MASDDGVDRGMILVVCADDPLGDFPACRSALWRRRPDGSQTVVIDGESYPADGDGGAFDTLYSSLGSDS